MSDALPSDVSAQETAKSELSATQAAPAADGQTGIVPAGPALVAPGGELTAEQLNALRHLVAGLSLTDTASATGIGRRTLYRWLHEDPVFAATLNLWKREQLESARTQMLGMLAPALKTVGSAVQQGDVSASLHVIRGLGVLTPQKPGTTDPDQLKRKRKIHKHRKEQRLAELERKYRVPDDNPIETVAEWDKRLDELLELRDHMIERDENQWRHYERTLHMTEEQLLHKRWKKPAGAPTCPRPSEAQIVGMCERESIRHHWDIKTHTKYYLEKGRRAAEAAKGPTPEGQTPPWFNES
jgi:hypothetical protein